MSSAVESHFGPGRPYGTHHYGSLAVPAAPLPVIGSVAGVGMSAAEFARPHPKTSTRYNGSQSLRGCNGLNGRKFPLEQTSPVNLAVSSHQEPAHPSVMSSPTANIQSQSTHNEQDAIHHSIASLYGPSKLPNYSQNGPSAAAAAYQVLSYSNMYPSSVYAPSAVYPPSALPLGSTRPLHHTRPPYRDLFQPYQIPPLPPHSAYSPPSLLSPQSPIGAASVASAAQPAAISQNTMAPSDMRGQSARSTMSDHKTHNIDSNSCSLASSLSPPTSAFSAQQQHYANDYRGEVKEKSKKSSNEVNDKSAGFKIPSGKEGSMKHRILTRPHEKDGAGGKLKSSSTFNKNNNSSAKSSSSSHHNNNNNNNNNNISNSIHCTNFTKGSLIELGNGEFKRVEDMSVEDFTLSSNKNPKLQLIDTTVVKISPKSSRILITFSYENNKIDIESTCGHPFYVYGKGWASYKPDYSLDEFGLKCQPLEVGDVCISLRPRETRDSREARDSRAPRDSREHRDSRDPSSHRNASPPTKPQQPQQPQQQQQSLHYNKHQYYSQPQLNYNNCSDGAAFPQNLSRKQPPHTISTTATATAVTSRPVPPFDLQSSQYVHHLQHQQRLPLSAATTAQLLNEHAMRQHYAEMSALHRAHPHEDRRIHAFGASINGGGQAPFHRTMSHDGSPQKYNLPPPPLQLALPPPPPSSSADTVIDNRTDSPDIIDASTNSSRKRRWSAPDNVCDVDGCQMEQKKCTKH